MLKRIMVEKKYDWRRINKVLNDGKTKKILPEILDIEGFEEQPFAILGSGGMNERLGNSGNSLFITGPCIISAANIKDVVSAAEARIGNKISNEEYLKILKEILEKQPSLQNIVSAGVAINNGSDSKNDILCIMETYEMALLMANNNPVLFKEHENELLSLSIETARRIEKMIENFRRIKDVKSEIHYFYTHGQKEKRMIDRFLDYLMQSEIRPRKQSYFLPLDWRTTSKARIELTYTKMFMENIITYLKKEYDAIAICENYKHFHQIFDGTFILPLEYFGFENANWIGIIPVPSLQRENETDVSEPVFLGKNMFEKQIKNKSIDRFLLGSYILSLLKSSDLNGNEHIIDSLFRQRLRGDEKEKVISEAKDILIKNLMKIAGVS